MCESEVITIRTPVSRVGNKTALLNIIYALFPLKYGRFIDVFGGSGSVLLGNPEICPFEVYNDYDRNLANLFRCMKERTMATVRELGFCHLNSREDFIAIRRFFENEQFDDKYLTEELKLTDLIFPPPEAKELKEIRTRITNDYDVRRAAMFLKLLRYSYSSSGKSYASQPFDIRKLFELIMRGWLGYYGIAEMDTLMKQWNEWLRRRIRMYIWKQWKKPKTRMENLKKLGMPEWQAYRNGNTRKGYWAIAGSGILHTTITNERLARRGYYDISEAYKSVH